MRRLRMRAEPVARAEVLAGTQIKKEAQIKIQAVAKIQYPIKSHCNKANSSPNGFKGRISGFGVPDEEFRGFFSSAVHEILQFNFYASGVHRVV